MQNGPSKTILFYIQLGTEFQELFRVGKFLHQYFATHSLPYQVLFYLNNHNPNWQVPQVNVLKAASIPFIEDTSLIQQFPLKRSLIEKIQFNCTTLTERCRLNRSQWKQFSKYHTVFTQQLKISRFLRKQYQPVMTVIGEDGMGAPFAWLKTCQQNNIPIVTIPYNIPSIAEPLTAIRETLPVEQYQLNTPAANWYAKHHPKWLCPADDKPPVLRERPWKIASIEHFGFTPKNPWSPYGDLCDVLVAFGPAMKTFYKALGVPASKLIALPGSFAHDDLYAVLKESPALPAAWQNRRPIQPNHRRILFTLPPSYFAERNGDQNVKQSGEQIDEKGTLDFPTFQAFAEFYIRLSQKFPNTTATFQFHPASRPDEIELFKTAGVHITTQPLTEELPKHDIFVSTASSTIRWAISCHKPTLNFDVYQFGYTDYADVPGVLTTQRASQFEAWFDQLVMDDAYFNKISTQQAEFGSTWGQLDGTTGERLTQILLDRFLNQQPVTCWTP